MPQVPSPRPKEPHYTPFAIFSNAGNLALKNSVYSDHKPNRLRRFDMRLRNAVAIAGMLALLPIGAATAADQPGQGMMAGQGQGQGMMMDAKCMKEHHKMMHESMGMLKDTMSIMKEISHSPSKDQKKKLDDMTMRLGEMMKMHEDMMKGDCMMKGM